MSLSHAVDYVKVFFRLQLTGPAPPGIANFNVGFPIILSRKKLLKHEKNLGPKCEKTPKMKIERP